ncbi:hypothetical protein [Halopseudomonas xiamenensis]|uniref:hypothetical protein n=1 Tax=Halopseudomonas xiamenensis TaxID=157792 RepID=UPI001629D2E2|nr:hypothetical protein [Halopseudomonas xiamenensis]
MTYQDYLDLVVQTVAKNLKPGSRYITTAALGGLLLKASPEQSWKAFGKRTLSELLVELESSGKLTRIKTEKDALAVSLGDAASVPPVAAIEKFNPLRKPVWDAFVLLSPEGKRFLNRQNGVVRVALDVAPTPADDWIEIPRISVETQKEWAREFLSERLENDANLAVQGLDEDWHPQVFVQELKHSDEATAHLWNQFRSAKVSVIVRDWLEQHSLSHELAFQSGARPNRVRAATERTNENYQVHRSEDVRQVILAALSNLPLEKLLEIPIPAGVMLSALSDTKLR